jgi:hypothetical protein
VSGSLTVRGRTRPVSFDAKVSSAVGEVWLDGEVQVNRRTWASHGARRAWRRCTTRSPSTPSSPAREPARSARARRFNPEASSACTPAPASPCSSAPEQSAVTGPSWIHGTKHDNCTSLTRARTPRSVATDEVRLEDDLPIITNTSLFQGQVEVLMRRSSGPLPGSHPAWAGCARFPAAGIIGSRAAASRTPCGRRCAAGLRPVLDPAVRSLGLAAAREREQWGS